MPYLRGILLGFISEIGCRRLSGGYRHLLCLGSVLFLPRCNRVSSWRHALDSVAAVGTADCIRTLHDGDVAVHPGMDVALNRNRDFFGGEFHVERRGTRRLRLIPLRILRGQRMDVVRSLVAVYDL